MADSVSNVARCTAPMRGYRSLSGGVTLVRSEGEVDREVEVRCGSCLACRESYTQEWAIRCTAEARSWPHNSFLTLTYRDDRVPENGSLRKADFQKFMKRLRKSRQNSKIRYFHCGEYGPQTLRPHYHALMFNVGFSDAVPVRGETWKRSAELEETWGHGMCTVGEVTWQTAAYCARYSMKNLGEASNVGKVEGDPREPSYVTMSRNPGIGLKWLRENAGELLRDDSIVSGGIKYPLPKYFTRKLEERYPQEVEKLKERRKESVRKESPAERRGRARALILKYQNNLRRKEGNPE